MLRYVAISFILEEKPKARQQKPLRQAKYSGVHLPPVLQHSADIVEYVRQKINYSPRVQKLELYRNVNNEAFVMRMPNNYFLQIVMEETFWPQTWCFVVFAVNHTEGAPPLRLTIDCSDERISHHSSPLRSSEYNRRPSLGVDSFCSLIHNAIPKAVQDGKFILLDPDADLDGYSDTQVPMAIAPPRGYIPTIGLSKLKVPKLRVPKLNVPKLQPNIGLHKAPRVGSPMSFKSSMMADDDSSAERMEKLKKGVQKMLHFVKVLGQIDNYLSERIRIVVDKMSKTFAE